LMVSGFRHLTWSTRITSEVGRSGSTEQERPHLAFGRGQAISRKRAVLTRPARSRARMR
jgi:hypothetical protein